MSGIKGNKGFHHLPSYREDVKKNLKGPTGAKQFRTLPNTFLELQRLDN